LAIKANNTNYGGQTFVLVIAFVKPLFVFACLPSTLGGEGLRMRGAAKKLMGRGLSAEVNLR
jgi:hypothetical protein